MTETDARLHCTESDRKSHRLSIFHGKEQRMRTTSESEARTKLWISTENDIFKNLFYSQFLFISLFTIFKLSFSHGDTHKMPPTVGALWLITWTKLVVYIGLSFLAISRAMNDASFEASNSIGQFVIPAVPSCKYFIASCISRYQFRNIFTLPVVACWAAA